MERSSVAIALALTAVLSACGPKGVAGGPAPIATKKPAPTAAPVAQPTAAGLLGKMKEPMALARQEAFVTSLHDALPLTIATGGIGTLSATGALVSNNGGGLVTDNGAGLISDKGSGVVSDHGGGMISDAGASWRLLQAPISLLPEYTRVREDVVLHQKPEGLLSAILSLYDVKRFDRTPGADNEGALIDRFRMEVAAVKGLDGGLFEIDMALEVMSSKRVPFIDDLTVRQTGRLSPATGRFESVRMAYLMGFDVALPDGAVDRVDLTFTAEATDLVPALDEGGRPSMSYEARRMIIAGKNGHGDYGGEAHFRPGGAIEVAFTHARPDGARTRSEVVLRPDGASNQVATSEAGLLSLMTEQRADGGRAYAVRDLAGPKPVELPDAVTEAEGIGTFDLGGTKVRARVY